MLKNIKPTKIFSQNYRLGARNGRTIWFRSLTTSVSNRIKYFLICEVGHVNKVNIDQYTIDKIAEPLEMKKLS